MKETNKHTKQTTKIMSIPTKVKARMDSLVNLNEVNDLRQAAREAAKDLLEEGFDSAHVNKYLQDIVAQEVWRALDETN